MLFLKPLTIRSYAVLAALFVSATDPIAAQGTLADYQRGQDLEAKAHDLVVNVPGKINWIGETDRFWYAAELQKAARTSCWLTPWPGRKKRRLITKNLAAAISNVDRPQIYRSLTLPFAPRWRPRRNRPVEGRRSDNRASRVSRS